jgi:DNA-binding GntR family transcriptional regulator
MSGALLHQVSLREQALAVIRQQMITGEIVPGEIYSASALAEKLGVSNSPVREAMLTLVHQGLMEAVRNRGFRVIPLSNEDLDGVFSVRLMLEVPAMGELAASGAVSGHEQRYKDIAASIVTSEADGDLVRYLEYDREFHLGLLDLLHNPHLTQIVEQLRDQTRLYGLKTLSESGLLASSAKEHRPILDAIISGDRKLAERMMKHHLRSVQHDQTSDRKAT